MGGSLARRQRGWNCCDGYYQPREPDICRAAETAGCRSPLRKDRDEGRQREVSEREAALWEKTGRASEREREGCRSIQMRVGVLDKEKSTTQQLSLPHTHSDAQAQGSNRASATAEKKAAAAPCATNTVGSILSFSPSNRLRQDLTQRTGALFLDTTSLSPLFFFFFFFFVLFSPPGWIQRAQSLDSNTLPACTLAC